MNKAKNRLSKVVEEIRSGKEFEIVFAVADTRTRVMPKRGLSGRVLGMDRGLVKISKDFDVIDQEISRLFE
jgi:hypothetical protein